MQPARPRRSCGSDRRRAGRAVRRCRTASRPANRAASAAPSPASSSASQLGACVRVGIGRIHVANLPGRRRRDAHFVIRSAASSDRSASGRAPRCEITSAAASEPSCAHGLEVRALRVAAEETRRVQVAGAGRVDEPVDRVGVDHVVSSPGDDHRAVLGASERRDAAVAANRFASRCSKSHSYSVQISASFAKRMSTSSATSVAPLGPVAVDAERVRQRQRDLVARLVRDAGGLAVRLLGLRRGPRGSPRGTRRAPQRRCRRRRRRDRGTPTRRGTCSSCAARRA